MFNKYDCYLKTRWAQVQSILGKSVMVLVVDTISSESFEQTKEVLNQKNLQINNIVLLAEDMQHRSKRVLRRVIETYPDKNGLVRTVLVKM